MGLPISIIIMAGYSNRFAFLDADGEGVSIPQPKVVVAEAPKPVAQAKAQAPRPAAGRGRGGKGPRGDRPSRPRQENADGSVAVDAPREDRPRRTYQERHAKSTTGDHERRSRGAPGSERGEKRSGAGRFNWGKDGKVDQETVASSGEEAKTEETAEKVAAPVVEKTEEELLEERQMTMSQYQKQLEDNRSKLSALELSPRAAGEGEDAAQWKNNVQIKNEVVVDGLFAGLNPKEKKVVVHKKVESKNVTKELLKSHYESDEPQRENSGRGRRNGQSGRGRGGRTAAPKAQSANIKLSDDAQFPTLG